MKFKNYLFGMLACGLLAACSNDEAPGTENNENVLGQNGYISISIKSASDTQTRTATQGDYVAGEDTENAISGNALFVFFTDDGAYSQAVETSLGTLSDGDGSGTIEKKSNAILVINGQATVPNQVIAVLNSSLTATSLNNARPTLAEFLVTTDNYGSIDKFVMSNSVYRDSNGEIVTATEIPSSKIFTSSEDALKSGNSVEIYVERVLAKVTVADKQGGPKVSIGDQGLDLEGGEEIEIVPQIEGYQVVTTNPKSYLVKKISNYTFTWTWNNSADHRSFWADSYTPTTGESYSNTTWNSTDFAKSKTQYVQENTTTVAANTTKLLIKAKLINNDTKEAVSLVKHRGLYYTEAGFLSYLNTILKNTGFYYKTSEGESSYSNDWTNYLEVKQLKKLTGHSDAEPWEITVELKNNVDAFVIGTVSDGSFTKSDDTTIDNIKSILANNVASNEDYPWEWKDGMMYYYTDIEHFGTSPQNIGVVRNHVYQLTINSIKGLGTPVYDGGETIVPHKAEDSEYYVSASINILKWKIVTQTVDIEF